MTSSWLSLESQKCAVPTQQREGNPEAKLPNPFRAGGAHCCAPDSSGWVTGMPVALGATLCAELTGGSSHQADHSKTWSIVVIFKCVFFKKKQTNP